MNMQRATPWAIVSVLLLVAAASIISGRGPEGRGAPLVSYEFSQNSLSEFFACMDGEALLMSAHRGGPSTRRPENAMSTLNMTAQTVPALLEIDVRQSSDGVLFLFHDNELGRDTTGTGTANRPWHELATLQLKDHRGHVTADLIPTFADVLRWAHGRAVLQIDRKGTAAWSDIATAVNDASMAANVVAITYSHVEAAQVHDLLPQAMISVPIDSRAELDAVRALGIPDAQMLAWTGTDEIDDTLNRVLHQQGIPVIYGAFANGPDGIDLPRRIEDLAPSAHSRGIDILAVNQPAGVWRHLNQNTSRDDALAPYHHCLVGE